MSTADDSEDQPTSAAEDEAVTRGGCTVSGCSCGHYFMKPGQPGMCQCDHPAYDHL